MAVPSEVDPFRSGHRLAFVGVSSGADGPTRDLFLGLVAHGHEVIPILPGVEAAASLQQAGALDGVVIMTSPRNAERALVDCQRAGVRRAWLIGNDANGDARAFAARHAIELVILRDPIAVFDHSQGLLRRLTGRLRRLTSLANLGLTHPPLTAAI
ncbi:MAG: CoA-binding protein [Proteobacteria bacterium]|nr:CoA-binding protein [Pseudomonadota bacterium]